MIMLKCNVTETKTNIVQDDSDNYYINEKFVKDALQFPLTLKGVQDKFKNVTISKKMSKNQHYPQKTDTIIELKNNNVFFKFHKADSIVMIDKFEIKTGYVLLDKNIHVGMSRQKFIKKFDSINFNNRVEIGNLERTSVYSFLFIQDTLSVIEYTGYID